MALTLACERAAELRGRLDVSAGDEEFDSLRQRLELLESQRSLAAAKCQSFAAEMERVLAATATAQMPSPSQEMRLARGTEDSEDEWAAFGLSSAPKPKHTGHSRPRRASMEQNRAPHFKTSNRTSFEADAAAMEYYSSCSRRTSTSSRRSSFTQDASPSMAPLLQRTATSSASASAAAVAASPPQQTKVFTDFSAPSDEKPQGRLQRSTRLTLKTDQTRKTEQFVPVEPQAPGTNECSIGTAHVGADTATPLQTNPCSLGNDTETVDTSEASDAEIFLSARPKLLTATFRGFNRNRREAHAALADGAKKSSVMLRWNF